MFSSNQDLSLHIPLSLAMPQMSPDITKCPLEVQTTRLRTLVWPKQEAAGGLRTWSPGSTSIVSGLPPKLHHLEFSPLKLGLSVVPAS